MSTRYKNPGRIEFEGVIRVNDSGGAFVEFPYDVDKLYGVKGRIPVNATFGGIPYRGSMAKMGSERHLLLILKEIREKLGVGAGNKVHVGVELDDKPRVVELDADVEAAYRRAGVLEKYSRLSYSHQREFMRWIGEVKQAETRRRRLEKSIEELRKKKD
jgi:hypothetical protein